MKVAELVKISCELLKMLSKHEVKTDDYRYVEMYYEYLRLRGRKEKYRYVTQELANKYGVSRSTVERVIQRFRRDLRT